MMFRSREDSVRIKDTVMKDPLFANMAPDAVPVDGKRMFWGGFKPIVGEPRAEASATLGVQPYLFFRGRCEEAIDYYKAKLGAEVLMMLRFKDNPDKPPPDKVPAEMDERIMHSSVRINGAEIMMSDGLRTGPLDFQCMSLSLSALNEADADRLFNALAADGIVQMPIGDPHIRQEDDR